MLFITTTRPLILNHHGVSGRRERESNGQRKACPFSILLIAIALILTPAAVPAQMIDWSGINTLRVRAFYPGVASWEFLRGRDHGKGAVPVRTLKKACSDCHIGRDGSYDIDADRIISGELKKSVSRQPFEPHPDHPEASGFKDLSIQAAYDSEYVYLRFQWRPAPPEHAPGASQLPAGSGLGIINVQLANAIGSFRKFGCFIACHDDQQDMPRAAVDIKRLYAYYSHGAHGPKPQEQLTRYLARGQFIDLWRMNYVLNMVSAEDMYILHDRIHDNNDLEAAGSFNEGQFTMVVKRKLVTGDAGDITLKTGDSFTIGVAIHDYSNRGRRHYVTFPISIGLSSAADIHAQRL